MSAEDDDHRQRLARAAAGLRDGGALGRSDALIRLFDFLLGCSLDGRAPKEIEIAQAVFDKPGGLDTGQDASVRVYAHRLRRKLEEAGAAAPPAADRLVLPRGEYRLALAPAPPAADGAAPPPPPDDAAIPAPPDPAPAPPPARRRRAWWIGGAAAALLAANLGGWIAYVGSHRPPPYASAAASPFWQPIMASQQPTFLAIGDYYIYGEAPDGVQVDRLVRRFDINSKSDLDTYLMAHPGDVGRMLDVDLHYLPVGAGPALGNLLPIVAQSRMMRTVRPLVQPMSQLSPNVLKTGNIVYVGFLSALGALRDPLFAASGFAVGASYDELVDKKTGRRFTSDWDVVADGRTPHRDYAYLASLPGPEGNRIVIVAGTRDAAVMQAAEIAADARQLDRLPATGGTGGYEALFEVSTLGSQNLGSRLVLARPIDTAGIWQNHNDRSRFPDEMPPGGG